MPHVILFDNIFLHGNHKHVVAAEPNLAAPEDSFFNDRTQSFVILDGYWQFYQDINFQNPYPGLFGPDPDILGPGLYELGQDQGGVVANTLSSLQPVQQAMPAGGQNVNAQQAPLKGDHFRAMVTLFENAGFRGDHRHIFLNTPDLTAADLPPFNDVTSSLVVQGSAGRPSIQLCSDVDYGRPYTILLGNGIYSYVGDYNLPNDDLSSLQLSVQQPGAAPPVIGDQAFGEIILFEHESFRGAHKHVYQAEPDLGAQDDSSFLNKASSMWIWFGAWALSSQGNYQQIMPAWNLASFPFDQFALDWAPALQGKPVVPDAPVFFLPDAYPSFSGTGIANDSIRSLHLPFPDIYFITWDEAQNPQSVWLVVVAGMSSGLSVVQDGWDITSSLYEWHTYTDRSGRAWAHAYYVSLPLPRGQTHIFSVSCTVVGPFGETFKTSTATWFTAAPAPPPMTTVPTLIGQTESAALQLLSRAQLNVGQIWNLTPQIPADQLVVTGQGPSAGTAVPVGSSVNLSVINTATASHSGISVVHCYNISTDGNQIEIWTWDGSQWQDRGHIDYQNTTPLDVVPGNGKTLIICGFEPGTTPPNDTARAQVTVTGASRGPAYMFSVS